MGGAVIILDGSSTGLTSSDAREWTKDTPGVPSVIEPGDYCGKEMGSGDYGRSGKDDLAIGAHDDVGGFLGAGAVTVLYGRSSGTGTSFAQRWTQNTPGVKDVAEKYSYFGWPLGR